MFDTKIEARLVQADDCPDLLSKLQADAVAKLDLEIALFKQSLERQRELEENAGSTTGGSSGVDFEPPRVAPDGAPVGGFDAGAATSNTGGSFGGPIDAVGGDEDWGGAADPAVTTTNGGFAGGTTGTVTSSGSGALGGAGVAESSPQAPSRDSNAGAPNPVGGSDTNNQVREVDEADFVKMVEDRTRFYLLHGRSLYALDSWPATDLAQRGEPLEIEGSPSEMFVRDGKLVVFSGVNSYDVVQTQDTSPRAYQAYTKVTVIEENGVALTPIRELYFEGQYTSSRRYDEVVRLVLQAQSPAPNRFYPEADVYDAWGRPYGDEEIDVQLDAWRARTAASIENTELSDWLPRQYEVEGDGTLAEIEPACASHYTPLAGATDYGLTRVVTFDMSESGSEVGGVTVLGASSVVYSNLDTMLLAHNDYRWDERDFGIIDQQRTALHSFAIDGEDTQYQASGWAPGHVLNQFALDAAGEVVRVSTSGTLRSNPDAEPGDQDFWQTTRVNQVMTYSADAEGALQQLDTSGPIGHENETTRSTRFIDDRAYVVTFEQTDPLIVISLANPEKLRVLGELEIPGFSEYIHPLGDNHLLTIGQNGDQFGRTMGIALQIFDVGDPKAPALTHRHEFSPSSSSSAQYDHKAFTFYDAQGLLAFPMVDYGQQFSSTLQVFRVTTEDGFEPLGAVDHSQFYSDCIYTETGPDWVYTYYECYYQPDVRRGMFVEGEDDTYVYTVSPGGVTAHSLTDLDTPLAAVDLPEPDYYYVDSYFGGGWDGPVPGFATGGGFVAGTTGGSAGLPVDEGWLEGPADAGVSMPAPEPEEEPTDAVSDMDGGTAMMAP